jgi:hypothetical protein
MEGLLAMEKHTLSRCLDLAATKTDSEHGGHTSLARLSCARRRARGMRAVPCGAQAATAAPHAVTIPARGNPAHVLGQHASGGQGQSHKHMDCDAADHRLM